MKWLQGLDRLDRQAWLLLIAGGLFTFSTSLSITFVNVYLWKLKQNLELIGWYNLTQFLAGAVTFVLVGWFIKRVDRVISIRIGVMIQALFYLTVLFLGKSSAEYARWLGAFLGIGNGFYWLAYNVLYFEITERENRDIFNGINGLLTAGSGIVAPTISGFIITRFPNLIGYRFVFAISLLVFVLAIITTFLLRARSAPGKYCLKEVLCNIKKRDNWYWVTWAVFGQGLREGIFFFLLGILVYLSTKNELALGTYHTICSFLSLFSYFLISKFLQYQDRYQYLLFGSLMMVLVMIPYILTLQTWTILLAGFGVFLFFPFYFSPLTATVFDVIGQSQTSVKLRVEYVVAREITINLGRIISSLTFILLVKKTQDVAALRWLLLIFGSSQLLSWFSIRNVPLQRKTPTIFR